MATIDYTTQATQAINENITANGRWAITGPVLNGVLNNIMENVSQLGRVVELEGGLYVNDIDTIAVGDNASFLANAYAESENGAFYTPLRDNSDKIIGLAFVRNIGGYLAELEVLCGTQAVRCIRFDDGPEVFRVDYLYYMPFVQFPQQNLSNGTAAQFKAALGITDDPVASVRLEKGGVAALRDAYLTYPLLFHENTSDGNWFSSFGWYTPDNMYLLEFGRFNGEYYIDITE